MKRLYISENNSKVSNKETLQKNELSSLLQEAIQSEDYKDILSLINETQNIEVQTIKNRRRILAKIYIHCHCIFKKCVLEKGRKAYLLSIFPKEEDNEQNRINRNYRNKYCRAMRLLDKLQAPHELKPLIKLIEKTGFQSLFNGKITDKEKKNSKFDLNKSIQKLLKKKASYQIIRTVLKNENAKNIKGDFVVCCFNNQLSYTSQQKLIKKLKKENVFDVLENNQPQD